MEPTASTSSRVVIIGGGIAGLSAAHRLLSRMPGTQVVMIEGEGRLGGKIATERTGGFLIESGPDSFLAAKPRGVGLCEEIGLGGELQAITPRAHRAYVLRGKQLHELPEGLTGLVPTKLGPLAQSRLLSPLGKARMAMDYALPARGGDDDESLGGF
ncbi:MAG: protoporphyrinogen/coproporphyrinogen oxidase, partial [Thermomicrobiales bacterium]